MRLSNLLGSFAGQLTENAIKKIELEFEGQASKVNTQPLLQTLICSLLKPTFDNVNIINGVGTDSSLGSKISVTVIATGFEPTEEEVEVVVGIGEDETLDSINSQNSKKDLTSNSFVDDFSQQSMFDFEEDSSDPWNPVLDGRDSTTNNHGPSS